MNTEDIDRMAQEVGFPERRAFSDLSDLYPRLERFAALVAAAEHNAMMQLFTDPENQPTQHGTVTVDYMQRFMNAERQIVVDSLRRQADLAVDDFDRRWALEMAAAVAARGRA